MEDKVWERAWVKLWDLRKGWGFFERTSGLDVFIHVEELKRLGYIYNLPKGKPVEIQVENSRKGPYVSNIREVGACLRTAPGAVKTGAQSSTHGNGLIPPQGDDNVKAVGRNGQLGK